MLDVRRILLFAEVARRGSVTATARALNYTPSAVSQQVSRLETEAGQPLLERHARGVTLTDAGRALADRAGRIERELTAAENELADFAGLRAGTLRIGTFPTVGASLLPQAVIAFREAHPDVRLTVRSARITGLWSMLENREIELSLMWDYDWSRIEREDVVVTPLLDDPPALLVSDRHPLAGRDSASLSDLAGDPWITRAESHPVAEALDRSCRSAGFEPQIAYEAHDYQEAQAMVAAGIGVALAPTLALEGIRPGVRVLLLQPPAPVRRILLVRMADHALTPAAHAFTELLRKSAATRAVQT
ncbi:LysR family transcriptional regulator [Streptomyces sp. NBC_01799]|uniref:LysR family transcriptional regulator n=1 Tax=Streptomyces sp. NBC_01800 TaxID=2975945 RepID=UPI002DDC6FFD|nr:LysR family transcriptional regulator [Streptomyces sp. NBC_01800]WSA72635.1 LysR family transcriptional regulator [Streptomyces sp. NBC_01800]WSA81164.1 LysR family transcriptional regulator [Streptomyces sp. NBC_01799]